uniref:Uncharacterized protein n=1 Tax=Ditylenchus dipsaci TaxID=166011 RepID=A0A915ETI0_9BILA
MLMGTVTNILSFTTILRDPTWSGRLKFANYFLVSLFQFYAICVVPSQLHQQVPVSAEDKLQLHDDEGTAQRNRKRHHYDAATKLEAVNWARYNRSAKSGNYNVLASSKKYKVDRKRIRQWISQEEQLKQQM